ncbi:AraC family transcriptional regulator [Rhodoblastus acidophilus]|uniref:AraC family transcriptional regulator n=1 Tax=Candidatus Rhodoblastus alkanivorans TaxID=2954117 RepID=A0ABS9Z5G0_9HYPH|nr:AraC family transcriptional regulator [Candidatus Rhodoblastus alkanivorans]MCI4678464.1 AraC family transcriptional regulator [Candidatus Rhodoblastus alkanivorans]MCI4682863.1 AraC family transcriptional regulator [Candidatus Rhodoblastus alkanivorans]MDI4640172.1 AraC family transcriptional regulator [Rhodoblastus acidophilus]
MAGTPEDLIETPSDGRDLLSDLLSGMRLSGTVLFRAEFREPWSVVTPDGCHLAQVLPFRTEHIIPFHIIAAGGCWLGLRNDAPVWLAEGDAVLLPYGDSHGLYGRETAAAVEVGKLLPPPPWPDILVVEHGGAGAKTSVICGFLQCDELLFHPLLRHLPRLLHVSSGEETGDRWLGSTIRHTADETSRLSPGSRSMLPRLTELMFVEILRAHIHGLSADDAGWFAALNDPVAGAALKWLHAEPMKDWSVEELARRVGTSRSVLNEHFRRYLDQPPIRYLAKWRLQLAAQQMKTDSLPMKAIAEQYGYESEAAFNRAFKRCFGLPPGDWRKRQARN